MLDTLFLSVLNMSIIAGIVTLVVVLVRLFLKKVPKIFSYALWVIVLFRLICPFSFESAIGLLPINQTPIPQDIIYQAQPQIDTGISSIDNSINLILPAPPITAASVNPLQIWTFTGSHIWLMGMAIMLIYSIVQFVKLRRKLVGATPLHDNIYIADHISSPFVMGLIKPKIYLPSAIVKSEQAFIISHEQCHIKRLDHITRILAFVALTFHWFNPLVWLGFILSGRDMEMSCDEAVMKKMGSDIRAEYSQSLLRFSTGKRIITATPLAFGEGDTKGRVKNVMKYKKPMLWVVVLAFIVVVCVAVGFMTNPKTKHGKELDNVLTGVLDSSNNSLADFETIKIGTTRDKIFEQFGEPNAMLFGMYGDVYVTGNKQIIIYYKFGDKGIDLVTEVKISDYTPKMLTHDQAVASALTSDENYNYGGECIAEGHIILGYDDSDKNETKIYALTMNGWYGFENNNFVKVSGSGVVPAVITLTSNNNVSVEYPQDGSGYGPSIEKMFPKEYHQRIFKGSDSDYSNLKEQEEKYASEYLSKIDRDAKIGSYSDFEHILLTDVGVSVEASNKLEDFYKKHNYYPGFIGTRERIENGVRVVYEMSYEKNQDEIRFIKYNYDTKETTEQFAIDAKTGVMNKLT